MRVDVYGSPTPIKSIASVGTPEPTQIVIRPFDPSTLKDIEKGIIGSTLGYTPQNDGKVIRINIPPLSTEVRKKMVTQIKKMAEDAKISIRNVRRDGNKSADQEQKDKTLTEDERDSIKSDIQDLTKKFEQKIDELAKAREADVMED